MTDSIEKRPNYFPGQYLLEDDFELEQQYHLDRQRRQNRLLTVSGIAQGLDVTVPETTETGLKVNISAGNAIDQQGRMIVWSKTGVIDLQQDANKGQPVTDGDYILSISYNEELTDLQDGTSDGERRWHEKPKFQLINQLSDNEIALSKLNIAGKKIGIDNNIRVYSGLRLPASKGKENQEITLKSAGDSKPLWADFSGSLSIEGDLSIEKSLIVEGKTELKQNLQIINKSENADGNTLILGNTNASNLRLGYEQKYTWIQSHGGKPLAINPIANNVGIGTDKPNATLEVNGDLKIANNIEILTDSNPIRFSSRWSSFPNDVKVRAEISNDTSDYKTLMIVGNKSNDNKTRRVSVWDRLEVNGDLRVTQNISGSGNLNFLENNNEIFFRDQGQLRSSDNKHRILFRRNEDKLELREYGDLIFSPGATQGEETAKIVFKSDGKVGIGTDKPNAKLEVNGDLKIAKNIEILTASNPIRFSSRWSGFSQIGFSEDNNNRVEISNDTSDYKTLMIVGNKSNDNKTRRVSVWDRLEVNGSFSVTQKLIEIRKYATNADSIRYKTNYTTKDWVCSIAGFDTGKLDVNEKDAGVFMQVYTYIQDGYWYIRADVRSHNDGDNWTVWVMAIRKSIAKTV